MGLLENQNELGHIDLFYADATHISQEGYVPYGWQFDDERVAIPVQKGGKVNVFGLYSRIDNAFYHSITTNNITAEFVKEFIDEFSFRIRKQTVVVLDNASVHTAKKIKQLLPIWQKRGLYIFYLPPYSPQLNIIERLWKEVKQGWIKPEDYQSEDQLYYAVNRICNAIGKYLFMKYKNKGD